MIINIRDYTGDLKVLVGRSRSSEHRELMEIDKLDQSSKSVVVVFDDDFTSLTSSYFLGLFGKSIRKLGREGFKKKYKFTCKDVFQDSIDKYISIVLGE